MDEKYNTQFHSWVRSEANVDFVAFYLRRILADYDMPDYPDKKAVSRAIRWLTEGWTVQRIAELLIKLFYHWSLDSEKFAMLVSDLVKNWDLQPFTIDLIVTLVVGERSIKAARFVYNLTKTWDDPAGITELVSCISSRLRWTERYHRHFILHFLNTSSETIPHRRITPARIRARFAKGNQVKEERRRVQEESSAAAGKAKLPETPNASEDDDYVDHIAMQNLATGIFEAIVLEALELRLLAKNAEKATKTSTISTAASVVKSEGTHTDAHVSVNASTVATNTGAISTSCSADDLPAVAYPDYNPNSSIPESSDDRFNALFSVASSPRVVSARSFKDGEQ